MFLFLATSSASSSRRIEISYEAYGQSLKFL
jgi:hypothetical protein